MNQAGSKYPQYKFLNFLFIKDEDISSKWYPKSFRKDSTSTIHLNKRLDKTMNFYQESLQQSHKETSEPQGLKLLSRTMAPESVLLKCFKKLSPEGARGLQKET